MRWLIVLCLVARTAHAEDEGAVAVYRPPPPSTEPAAAMTSYFRGEVIGGFTLIGMGVVGLSTGGVMLAT